MDGTSIWNAILTWIAALLATLGVMLAGCAQSTDTPVDTYAQTTTPADLQQVTDQFGNSVREPVPRQLVFGVVEHLHLHAPISNDAPVPEDLLLTCAPDGSMGPLEPGQVEGANATHSMTTGAVTITVTQSIAAGAEQAATPTGTVQPGVSVAQTPTVTAYPTQHIEPAIAIDVPIGLWGGIAQGAANAAQGDATQSTEANATAKYMQLLGQLAELAQVPEFWEWLEAWSKDETYLPVPTSQPSTPQGGG